MPSTDISRVDMPSVLALVAQQAASVTGAHGVAIAIGNAKAMCCCASVGDAPAVGVLVGPESGLSGICMRTSEVVECDDAAADPRIDPVASRQMNLGSALIVPVIADGRLQGMLQAISSKPHAFRDHDRELLCRMAQRVASLLGNAAEGTASTTAPHPMPARAAKVGASTAVAERMRSKNDSGGGAVRAATAVAEPAVVSAGSATVLPEVRASNWSAVSNATEAHAADDIGSGQAARAPLSPMLKAAGLMALVGVLALGVYEFAGVGRSTTRSVAPAPAASSSGARAMPTAAALEISVEQNSLAVGLEQGESSGAGQLTPGQLLRRVDPVYPASLGGVSGSVVLSALVDKNGRVARVRVVRGPEELAGPAAEAVRQWVYEPYRLGGAPVAAESMITIKVAPRKQH